MTELELRNLYIDTARSYYGAEQGSAQHRELLEYYNSNPNLPRDYRMTVNDPWCAATVSAVALRLGLEGIIFPECSCSRMIRLYQSAGRWQEADSYIPEPGDLILYDWDDNGTGDCTGDPDHIGIVARVEAGVIQVIEGNMDSRVWARNVPVDGKHIRGYCLPDYADLAGKEEPMSKFKDVKDGTYYAEPVEKAAELGLMVGVSADEFGVGQPVTREQLATVIVKLYELLSK